MPVGRTLRQKSGASRVASARNPKKWPDSLRDALNRPFCSPIGRMHFGTSFSSCKQPMCEERIVHEAQEFATGNIFQLKSRPPRKSNREMQRRPSEKIFSRWRTLVGSPRLSFLVRTCRWHRGFDFLLYSESGFDRLYDVARNVPRRKDVVL